ncbi:hypothetical protein AVEN_54878-1 [Araneus ventricosus]|uniref:Uncharacterized protein n=1 Tax=Araneus ventricosus TaxID=182803 RepID=A0A4Y2IFU7_ARAVE|nr:hypothetical protein AVEN_54878-1 [Araneus ventricosus]
MTTIHLGEKSGLINNSGDKAFCWDDEDRVSSIKLRTEFPHTNTVQAQNTLKTVLNFIFPICTTWQFELYASSEVYSDARHYVILPGMIAKVVLIMPYFDSRNTMASSSAVSPYFVQCHLFKALSLISPSSAFL